MTRWASRSKDRRCVRQLTVRTPLPRYHDLSYELCVRPIRDELNEELNDAIK